MQFSTLKILVTDKWVGGDGRPCIYHREQSFNGVLRNSGNWLEEAAGKGQSWDPGQAQGVMVKAVS